MPARLRQIHAGVRRAVIERDGLVCQLCEAKVVLNQQAPNALHLDHIIPWSEGGEHEVANLRVTCRTCNLTRPRPIAMRFLDSNAAPSQAHLRRSARRAHGAAPLPESAIAAAASAQRLSARQRQASGLPRWC